MYRVMLIVQDDTDKEFSGWTIIDYQRVAGCNTPEEAGKLLKEASEHLGVQ